MEYDFYKRLYDLFDKCDLNEEEKSFLEHLAEFIVFPNQDKNQDPRTLFGRSIHKLKEGKQFLSFKELINDYQKKFEKKFV